MPTRTQNNEGTEDPSHFDSDLAEAIKKGDRSSMDIIAEKLAGNSGKVPQVEGASPAPPETYVDPTATEDPNYNKSVDPENNGYSD